MKRLGSSGGTATLIAVGLDDFAKPVQQDEVKKIVIGGENEEIVAGFVAKRPADRLDVCHGDALHLEEVDLQEPLIVREKLYPPNPLLHRLLDSEVSSRLCGFRLRIVAERVEKRCEAIGIVECL